VIDKIINYETQSNNDYFNNIILAGIDGFPEPGNQFELITEHIADYMRDFNQVKLYESKNNFNPSNINDEINKGAGFFICSSHGTPGSFHNYFKFNIRSLSNYNKFPIVFLNGCYCAQLDSTPLYNFQILLLSVSLQLANNPSSNPVIIEYINNFREHLNQFSSDNLQDCIAWDLLKADNCGSIISIGGVRSGTLVRHDPPSGFSGLFSIKFFESYEPGIIISDMYNNAISSFIYDSWRNYVTIQRFILLGDPSLKIGGYIN
jgi:hypothetical protein